MKRINIVICSLAALCLSSCFSLDKEPEGVLSTARPFVTTGEMKNYVDMFYNGNGVRYQSFATGGGSGIAGYDTYSDNMAASTPVTRIAGLLSVGNATTLSLYTDIRNVNFFLNNLDNCSAEGSTEWNQYVGEGYYFRAWFYYQLLINYGPVAWLDTPLDPDPEQMKYPRDSRLTVTNNILDDLDDAIIYLNEKNNSSSMRIHKDVARALKSEVALFEGTWEKYHKAKNTGFQDPSVTDADITGLLQKAAAAAKEVMDRGVWAINSTGTPLNDYRIIFQTTDLGSNKEILWFKKYDGSDVGNNTNRYLNRGGGNVGVTASLVDDYLTKEGKPFLGEEKINAKKNYAAELSPENRDPRLSQTVCMPGQKLRIDSEPFQYPPLIGKEAAYHQNTTGYSLLKHVQIDATSGLDEENKGATPAIQFRYADVLLNYAEALAELNGAENAQEIINAIHPLRARVGMPDMDFDREYNTDPAYPFHNLNKYIQAVRRERRVEKACEGRRFEDILRWAAADVLLTGQWPTGALFTGGVLENADYGGTLVYDQPSGNNLYLTGHPGDAIRYIYPMNPEGYPDGYGFKLNRDYLLPIQQRMISLTDGLWEQNPGW